MRPPYFSQLPPACNSYGIRSAQFTCSSSSENGGSATLHGLTSFDPATGEFKSEASIFASNYELSRFVPTYDDYGGRLYTGKPRPDVLGVTASLVVQDQLLVQHLPGNEPARLTLLFDVDGLLNIDPIPEGATAYSQASIGFCTGPAGFCSNPAHSSQVFSGTAAFGRTRAPYEGFNGLVMYGSSPTASVPTTISYEGETVLAPNGRLTLANIPLSSAYTGYDFNFSFLTSVTLYHPSAAYGYLPEGCDPDQDEACGVLDPVSFTGAFYADFAHTVSFAGFQAFDASGRNISGSVEVRLAGANLALAPILPAVTAPEPGTWVLLGSGLLGVGLAARRRRAGAPLG